MTGRMAKTKGAAGEREAKAVLLGWLQPVYDKLGLDAPTLERNLMQSRAGGFDLVGIDWLAVEVKRQEQLNVNGWWAQTVRQANSEQTPFLMYRQNRGQWRFMVRVDVLHYGIVPVTYDIQLDADQARLWLQWEAWKRLADGTA